MIKNLSKNIILLKHNHHEEAAKHHEEAAKHHKAAHKHLQDGQDDKVPHEAHSARGHLAQATGHAEHAAKNHSEKISSKRAV